MRIFILLIIASVMVNCKPKQNMNQPNNVINDEMVLMDGSMVSTENVKIEKFLDSSLKYHEDNLNGFYAEIVSGDNDTDVITIKYSKTGPEGTMDGNYSETLYFEVPNKEVEMQLSNTELQDVKMIYEKACYCKGEAGYYKVKEGSLKVERNKDYINIQTEFSIPETSQQVKKVQRQISL